MPEALNASAIVRYGYGTSRIPENANRYLAASVLDCAEIEERNVMPMQVFAKFSNVGAATVRTQTRLYLSNGRITASHGYCAGVVWLCNPASKGPIGVWQPCATDPTFEVIAEVFTHANVLARRAGKTGAAPDDYLQILNLHSVCDAKPASGFATFLTSGDVAEQPDPSAHFSWLAWGNVAAQGLIIRAMPSLAGRLDHIFYDARSRRVETGIERLRYPVHPRAARYHPQYFSGYVGACGGAMADRLP
jgi:hypothetical protein